MKSILYFMIPDDFAQFLSCFYLKWYITKEND